MRAWLLLFLLALPAAQAASLDNPHVSTAVTLYPHLLGSFDMPMNPREPAANWTHSAALGLASHSQGCVDVPGLGLASSTYHSFYAYPGQPVDYTQAEPGPTGPRGIYQDILLDTNQTANVNWYFEVDATPNGIGVEIPLAQIRVAATLREGDAISVNHAAMNSGRILALGESDPTLLARDATQGARYLDGPNGGIYHFSIPLNWAGQQAIGRDTGFNLRLDMRVDVPGCNDPAGEQYVMPDVVRIHTSQGFRPSLQMSIFNPVTIESLTTRIVNGTATATALLITPWGPQNLAPAILNLTPAAIDLQHTVEVPSNHRREALTTHWTWTPSSNGTLQLQVRDLQGGVPASATLPVHWGSKTTTCSVAANQEALCHTAVADRDSPGPVALGALLIVMAMVLLRRGQYN